MGRTAAWIEGWRGALLAALLAVACALPGLVALPVVDTSEAAFAQASAQMLDERDPTDIRFQQNLRRGAMPAAHWLQAGAVALLSDPEARDIWVYRLPSLLAVALCAAAAVLGGGRLFGAQAGFVSGVILAASLIGVTLADQATAEALFAAAAAVMLAAFAHLYTAAKASQRLTRRARMLFWAGLIAAFLIKGPVILAAGALTALALLVMDRGAPWARKMGWTWGLLALAATAGPWLAAITVSTDGQFWSGIRLFPDTPSHPGLQTLAALPMLFPFVFVLPFAAAFAWNNRQSAGVRLAVAWLVPAWVMFELWPGFRLHGVGFLFIAIAWLGAAGLTGAKAGRLVRALGAAFAVVGGAFAAWAAVYLTRRFGGPGDMTLAALVAAFAIAAGLAGVAASWREGRARTLALTTVLGVGALWSFLALSAPSLDRLWPTRAMLQALAQHDLDPREGRARGPVAAAGYAAPSLVFRLGAQTQLGDAQTAAQALADNRPAIVAQSEEAALSDLLAKGDIEAEVVSRFEGYDISAAAPVALAVYRAKDAP